MTQSVLLHGYYRSSASFRVRIALALKGVSFEQRSYHLRRGEQREPGFRAVNPQAMVPVLEIDGARLTQSLAMLEYLEERIPAPPLLPSKPADRAYVRSLAQLVACDIHPIDNLRVLRFLRERIGVDEAGIGDWYNHWISVGFAALEERLASDPRTGRFCLGDDPGLADVCLVPQVVNAGNYDLDLAPYPTITRIHGSCMAIPAFADAHPAQQPDAE